MSTHDQRIYERLPFSQKVKLLSAGKMVIYAMAINIGMGGVLLNASVPLKVGSQCRLSISVPGGEGIKAILTEGTIVRSDGGGTAVRFLKTIDPNRFETLFSHSPSEALSGSFFASYQAYFRVSQNKDLADCEKLLGVSKATFRTTFYITFISCISISVLAVWLLRSSIPALPNWIKVILCFGYGTCWLTIIQPSIDLTVFHFLKQRE